MDELPIILVVEDEWHLKEFVKDALTDAGFDMTASPSAEEAITVFRSGAVKYRALVTDIQLKGEMSSWELARNVREIEPSFPVVYVTGAAADEWASQCSK